MALAAVGPAVLPRGVGGGMGGGGGGGGMGMMYVAPEKVESLKVPTVCLEHGKAEPRPTVPYEIRPLESFTNRPAVKELCRMLGHRTDQPASGPSRSLESQQQHELGATGCQADASCHRIEHAPISACKRFVRPCKWRLWPFKTAQQRQQPTTSSSAN